MAALLLLVEAPVHTPPPSRSPRTASALRAPGGAVSAKPRAQPLPCARTAPPPLPSPSLCRGHRSAGPRALRCCFRPVRVRPLSSPRRLRRPGQPAHSTLNPKQKVALANRLGLRQVEVWFQNRRAQTKLKQTEVDSEYLKRWCERLANENKRLANENKRLEKELADLRLLKATPSPAFALQSSCTTGCA